MTASLNFSTPVNVSALSTGISPGPVDLTLVAVRATIDEAQVASGETYLQIFENNGFPVTDDVPVISVPFVKGFAQLHFGVFGRFVSGATYVALSSTPLGYTQAVGVSADLQALFDIQYL